MTTQPTRIIGALLLIGGGHWALGTGPVRHGPGDGGHGRGPRGHAAEPQSYVTVVDADDRPVLGLSSEDFSLRDGAVRQAVIGVEPATTPLAVAVVVDGFDASDRDVLARAIAEIGRRLAAADARHQVSFVGTSSTGAATLMPAGADRGALSTALSSAGAGSTAAGSQVDALAAACRLLQNAPTDRRAVLALARRRVDRATVPAQPTLTDAILLGRVALWPIQIGAENTPALDRLLTDSAALGGALRQTSTSVAAAPDLAGRVADLLISQYLVTYDWPNPMLSQLTIALRHDRGAVLAPIWTR